MENNRKSRALEFLIVGGICLVLITFFSSAMLLYGVYRSHNCEKHVWNEVSRTEATCTTEGEIRYDCTECGKVSLETLPTAEHTPQTVEAEAATCEAEGYTAYTVCGVCGVHITEPEVLEALGHTVVVDKAVAETCLDTGLTEGSHCARCEKVLTAQEVIYAKGHTATFVRAIEATCETEGLTAYTVCGVCGVHMTEPEKTEALGHTVETLEAIAPTCGSTGWTEGTYCDVCDKTLTAQEVVPATGAHTDEDGNNVCDVCNSVIMTNLNVFSNTANYTTTEYDQSAFTKVKKGEVYRIYFPEGVAEDNKYVNAVVGTITDTVLLTEKGDGITPYYNQEAIKVKWQISLTGKEDYVDILIMSETVNGKEYSLLGAFTAGVTIQQLHYNG